MTEVALHQVYNERSQNKIRQFAIRMTQLNPAIRAGGFFMSLTLKKSNSVVKLSRYIEMLICGKSVRSRDKC